MNLEPGKLYYSYEQFSKECKTLSKSLTQHYDAIIAISRGGLTLAHFMAQILEIRKVYSINIESYDGMQQRDTVTVEGIENLDSSKKYLIVEDIVDSGKTMQALESYLNHTYPALQYETAALFFKESAVYRPHYYVNLAEAWIDFFWEADTLFED